MNLKNEVKGLLRTVLQICLCCPKTMTSLLAAAVHSGGRLLPDFVSLTESLRGGAWCPQKRTVGTLRQPCLSFWMGFGTCLGLPLCVNLNFSLLLQQVPTLPIRIGAALLGSFFFLDLTLVRAGFPHLIPFPISSTFYSSSLSAPTAPRLPGFLAA